MSLKSIKSKIRSIDKTRQVTKAMEAVSAVKMRKSQEVALGSRPYALGALKILRSVAGTEAAHAHPLMTVRPVKKTGIIVITSDKGLAGSLNSAVLRKVTKFLEEKELTKENVGMFCIGRRGAEHFEKRGYVIEEHLEQWGDLVDIEQVEPLTSKINDTFESEEYDEFYAVYTNFISTLNQEVYVRTVLPLRFEGVTEMVEGILPETGRYSGIEGDEVAPVRDYLFEPGPAKLLNEIIPLLLRIEVYHTVLEANASEHSARMISMKNASDNARDISADLNLKYNKERQTAITSEVSEIVSGMEALQ